VGCGGVWGGVWGDRGGVVRVWDGGGGVLGGGLGGGGFQGAEGCGEQGWGRQCRLKRYFQTREAGLTNSFKSQKVKRGLLPDLRQLTS